MKLLLLGLDGSGKTTYIFAVLKAFTKFGKDLRWRCEYAPLSNGLEHSIASFISNGRLPYRTDEPVIFDLSLELMGPFSNRIYQHRVEIMDVPGELLLSGRANQDIQRYIKYVDGVLLFNEIFPTSNDIGVTALYKFLLQNLSKDNQKREPLAAICLPKFDRSLSNFGNLGDIFSKTKFSGWDNFTFGKDADYFQYLDTIFDRRKSNLYPSSSVGWVKSMTGSYFPNITTVTGFAEKAIYNLEDWRPNNILEPLMWLIDNIEFVALDKNLRDPLYSQQLIHYWEWVDVKQALPNYEIGFIDWQKTK